MGREARAACHWGDASGMVTALLEGDTLLVRGEIRATVSRSAISEVSVVDGELRLLAGDVPVVLALGTTAARRWAVALETGPPSLEKKLGIDETTRVRVYGTVDDAALEAALGTAAALLRDTAKASEPANVIVIRANGGRELETALTAHLASNEAGAPVWVVYRKGKDMPLNEAGIRAAVRARGLVDTKVAGVSSVLSAQRFTPPVAPEPSTPAPPRRPMPAPAASRPRAAQKSGTKAAAPPKRNMSPEKPTRPKRVS